MTDPSHPEPTVQNKLNSSAFLVILRGPQAGEKITLRPGITILGREVGFILQDGRISRRHAQIKYANQEVILDDLQSTNGTFVNGVQISQSTLLQHGDSIRIGDTILTLRLEGEGEADPSILGARTPATKLDRGDSTLLVGRFFPGDKTPNNANEAEKSDPKSSSHPSEQSN